MVTDAQVDRTYGHTQNTLDQTSDHQSSEQKRERLFVETNGRHHWRLCRDRVLAGAAVPAEDFLQIFDVDVEIVELRLEIEPLVVEGAAEECTVMAGDER